MLTLSLGPLVLATSHLLLIVSLLLASVAASWLARRQGLPAPDNLLFGLWLLALLVARAAFVWEYREHFGGQPWWAVLDLRDGGFTPWPGVLAAACYGGRSAALRRPLGLALLVGLGIWGGGTAVLQALERSQQLPALTLRDAQGQGVELQSLQGQPLVINLWATWCPPCRREMPVLAQAQQRESGVRFLFVNQGEAPETVQAYLRAQGLALDGLLFDASAALGALAGSRSLPTTLFYDAHGRLRGTHLGELSAASLAQALQVVRPAPR
ncbi:TlpA disulfide reductase family protein [Pseudomonas sp. NW5]|uniref:TlpA family protein disulfide reductase n=1 Tax=Pseudomonas sp. NW5 TaxID=2934934 RepID=UPI0020223F1F|nr:TlpA disulfide reductase family protein [Pseudomonas sp. NW5]MCL7462399.1 TlpA family protein disulfide reductase [Pseudomonas sp. NW5]